MYPQVPQCPIIQVSMLGPMMLGVPGACGCMYGVVVYVASRTSHVNTFTANKIASVIMNYKKHLMDWSTKVEELAINE